VTDAATSPRFQTTFVSRNSTRHYSDNRGEAAALALVMANLFVLHSLVPPSAAFIALLCCLAFLPLIVSSADDLVPAIGFDLGQSYG
jgi:energy-coupling factor transporter transmembrane protein EcfT